jgi:hypothetical protein
MNRTAESMCGWPYEEAKGFPLNRVFNIKSAITQNLLNNPVEEVFRTGKVIEMVNHTVLIARDGTERNISDSAALYVMIPGKFRVLCWSSPMSLNLIKTGNCLNNLKNCIAK